jgi:hypothetical protein
MVVSAEIPARAGLREEVLAAFPPERRASRELQQLARRIVGVVNADTVGARVRAWARLADWTRPAQLAPVGSEASAEPPTESLATVVHLIETSPEVRAQVHASLAAMLSRPRLHALRRGRSASHRGFSRSSAIA